MAMKPTVTTPPAAARRTALTAARGAMQTLHSAASLVDSVDREAARMLRTAEGMARSAMARLEFLGRESAPKKPEKKKEEMKDADATMAGDGPAAVSARRRRRRRRSRRPAPPPLASEQPTGLALAAPVPLLAAARVVAPHLPGRTLQAQRSRERSPRRDASSPEASLAGAAHQRSVFGPAGFAPGQCVAFAGLTSGPRLEGSLGTVLSHDDATGRITVKVSATGGSVRVKPRNLKMTIFGAGGCRAP